MRIGIDVGGTFTDVVLGNDRTGEFLCAKVPTTPPELWVGVMNGIDKILQMAGATIADVDYIVHGTTIGTNALIERKGARTGLITTAGFIDVLEIGRIQRPDAGLYNFFVDNPPPLVPRERRIGVVERIDRDGNVVTPLDEASVREAVIRLKQEKVESVAVSLLFSFMNPAHERRVVGIVREMWPEVYISASSDICPELREYERTSTTVINAYLQPIMHRYLDRLTAELENRYGRVNLRIMQASGGTMSISAAKVRAINTVNSGPAGGVLAAAFVGAQTDNPLIIGVDMGGTSFDISVVEDGAPKVTSNGKYEGLPVRVPIIEVETIGAGGGSIAWIDKGGALEMGPESAGAQPGPACYGRGGTRPTCTDANLVLGRLNAEYFLGGEMKLDVGAARRAIQEHVATPLGISVEDAAVGMLRVINAKMAKGINANTVEKGLDAREFAMVCFGGAAALHAAELATELQVRTVIMPPLAGNLSAWGLLISDARHDYVQTMVLPADELDAAVAQRALNAMEEQGVRELRSESFADSDMVFSWSADMRYQGQSYELNVPLDRKELTAADIRGMVVRFHDLHYRRYGYKSAEDPVQLVNLRVAAVGKNPQVRVQRSQADGTSPDAARKGSRSVYFPGSGFVRTEVYERDRLVPGCRVLGPAVVEEHIASLVVPPGWTAVVDEYRNIILSAS